MITFKCKEDIKKLDCNNTAFPIIKRLIKLLIEDYDYLGRKHDPATQGYIVLLEPGDTERNLNELQLCWSDLTAEGLSLINAAYIFATVIGTDEYGLAFVIPNTVLPKNLQQEIHDTIDI